MAIAALFLPPQKVVDAVRDYVIKIDSETISDLPLKATLVYEALQRYNVSPAILAASLGKTTEHVNDYLSKRISPSDRRDYHGWGNGYREIDRAKIERQLKAEKQALGIVYNGSMPDEWLTNDIATRLAVWGCTDIKDFEKRHEKVEIPRTGVSETDDVYTEIVDSEYYVNKLNNARFPQTNGQWDATYEGSGGTAYLVKFTESNLPVFFTQYIDTSDRGDLMIIATFAAIVFTGGGYAAALGDSILGAVGVEAASVEVATAVGNTAFNTVVTGGDIGAALTKTATGAAGGYVGDFVGTGVDSVAVGKIAAAATTAAIAGKNVESAATLAALTNGVKVMDDYGLFSTGDGDVWSVDSSIPDYVDVDVINADMLTFDDLGISLDPVSLSESLDFNEVALSESGIDISSVVPDNTGNLFTQTGDFVELTDTAYVDAIYVDAYGNVRGPDNRLLIAADEAATLTEDQMAQKMFAEWSQDQGAVVNSETPPESRPAALPPAANQTKIPTITDQAKTYDQLLKSAVSIGASVKAIVSGTFRPSYQTSAYGTPRVQAVGVPVQRPDGSTVTNNGNGTQTIRYPNGQTVTTSTSYTGGGTIGGLLGAITPQTLLIGGGVLLAALLIAKRK